MISLQLVRDHPRYCSIDVHGARLESIQARGFICETRDDDKLVDVWFAMLPVVPVRREYTPHRRLERDILERAGSDGTRVNLRVRRTSRYNIEIVICDERRELCDGYQERYLDGQRTALPDATVIDHPRHCCRIRVPWRRPALHRPHHVIRRERFAVVPMDTVSELQGPRGRIAVRRRLGSQHR